MRRNTRPSATSLMVKSNSLRATKLSAGAALSAASGATATAAPTMPMMSEGFSALSASTTLTSERKEGVLVCTTQSSYRRASGLTSSSERPSGGASTSLEPGISATGYASQVGYQNK